MNIQILLNKYADWWERYGECFENQSITVENRSVPLIQREYADINKYSKYCSQNNIPIIEITPFYKKANQGLLFVNCNPSGTDYKYYGEKNVKNQTNYFVYDKTDSSYFNALKTFAEKVGVKDRYAIIDVFPIAIQNQAIVKELYKNAAGKQREAFNKLIEIFFNIIVEIHPRVIVATNAFVKDLFTRIGNKDLRSFRDLKFIDTVYNGDELVNYDIKIHSQNKGQDVFETTLFCGGMISGGHQMDTESKQRLIRDVRRYINLSIKE